MSGLGRRIVNPWQTILAILGIKKYRPAWMATHHAFEYLYRDFWSRANVRARGDLLPEQEEALSLLSTPSWHIDGWIEVE
jgi:hypothetical protein